MKKLLFFCFFIQISSSLFAQNWTKYYGYGQQPYAAYCIQQYDNGYILLGNINNYTYGWIVKTDINGNELWDIKIGDGVHETIPSNIEQALDNGFILCGGTTLYSSTHFDPFIMKLNSCGDLEWCKILNYDSTSDWGETVKPTPDGGFVMVGEFYGNDPNDRVRLFKFDRSGELFWYKIYNRDSLIFSENVRSLYVDTTNFLITGSCYYPNWLMPYYIQTDTSGNETWRLVYGQHTGFFVGDAYASVRDIHGNYYSAGGSDVSPELLKFSGNGYEMMNVNLFPAATSGDAGTILALNDTNYIMVAGWAVGSAIYLCVLKTDTLGNIRKLTYLPNASVDIITSTAKTFDNKIIGIGTDFIGANSRIVLYKFNSDLQYDSVYSRHFTYDSLCPDTIVSHTFNPNCGELVGLKEPLTNPAIAALRVFPNPATQIITVEFPKYIVVKTGQSGFGSTTVFYHWESTTLEVYDPSGKMIFENEIIRAQKTLELNVLGWHSGMYYFRLVYNNQMVSGEKVVVE
jgi:hypothetical protein